MTEFRPYAGAVGGFVSSKPVATPKTLAPEARTQTTPKIVFKKKTWRHREQELRLKLQIRRLIAKQRPLFVVEPLPEDDRVWFVAKVKLGRDLWLPKTYFKRCAICWELATLVERCVEDSTYHRWLCEEHKNK